MTAEKEDKVAKDYKSLWGPSEPDPNRWIDPELIHRAKDKWENTSPEEKAQWDATFQRMKELSKKYPMVMYTTTPNYRDEFDHRSAYDRIVEQSLILTTPRGKTTLNDRFEFLGLKVRQHGNAERAAVLMVDALQKEGHCFDVEVVDGNIAKFLGDWVGEVQVEYKAEKAEKKAKGRKPLPYYHNSKKPWKTR